MKTKTIPLFLFFAALFLTSSIGFAEDRAARYPIDQVIGATLNDQQNRIELVLNVTYPNGCYKPVATTAEINRDQRSISLTHITQIFEAECTQAIVHQYPTVDLQKLENNIYSIWDTVRVRYLGALVVSNNGVRLDRTQEAPVFNKEGGNYL